MPINFFDENAKTGSSNVRFGLCDDPPPSINPAYIDENDDTKWIGIVNNPVKKSIDFYPVDNCIPIYKPDGNLERRCDGMLLCDNNLSFIELKRRENKWLGDGRKQLTITIQNFQNNHDIKAFSKVDAYLCNSIRPIFKENYIIEIQKFKDDTGFVLNVQQNIHI